MRSQGVNNPDVSYGRALLGWLCFEKEQRLYALFQLSRKIAFRPGHPIPSN
jgi:hypothetical protein